MRQSAPDRVASLAANVRAEVARHQVKQQQIGDALGLNQRAVSRRLMGQVEWSAIELHALAQLLGMDTSQLMAAAS